ncbi:MAG: Oar protein [Bryobacterales bacterium]|nr:Oar protein [Bryobacterales bacterium]
MTVSTKNSDNVWLRLGVLTLCFLLAGTARLFGQADTGSITGTVTDPAGAVLLGVKVTITAVATNRQQTFTTTSDGRYSSGPLRVGEYRIEAELPGFKRLVRQNVLLQVQETAAVNLQLELGTINQEVTVTATTPLVRTEDASQGSVIEERRVKDLPLNGRDYLQLSLLSEGTLPPPGQGRTASGTNDGVGSRAGGFSAGGQRTTDNNYLLDGFDNNTDDTSFDTNQAEVVKPSVDAIQEFKVQTNAYSAEFGRAAGGVVNLTMKSGTNLFHGTAYDFLRNEKLDARNFFDAAKTPPFKRNDYGFTFGGPAIKNKAFFFFAWETLKRRESATVNNTIPTLAMRQGDFSSLNVPIYDPLTYDPITKTRQVFPGNTIPANRIDPIAQQLINLYPNPQNNRLSQNFIFNPPNREDVGRINTREDYQISQRHQLSWIFNTETDDIPASTALPPPAFGGNTRATNVQGWGTGLTWTDIVSPGLVTSTKFGWFKDEFLINFSPEALAIGNLNAKLGLQTPPSNLNVTYPTINVSGFTSLGVGNFEPVWSDGQNRQIKNDTNWIRGAHTIKFGAESQWIQTNNVNARNQGGSFTFSGRYTRNSLTNAGGSPVADLLLGNVDNSTYSTSTRVEARAILLGGYLQDDWKVNQRFTLNVGLRYEFLRPFEDKYNKLANLDMDTNPLHPQLILESQVGRSDFIHANPFNFQPRVGLAYQLLPDKVVVRAGYGIYSPFQRFSPFGDSSSIVVNPPYNVSVTTSSDGITPASLLKSGIPADQLSLQHATSVSLASLQRDPPHSYSQQWNTNIQYQFASNWMFQVGYFGDRGVHLANLVDTNYVTSLGPGNINQRRRITSVFIPLSIPGGPGPASGVTISPIGSILRQENTGNSIFHSMQAKVEHRFSGGFTILASWIWSKGLGDIRGGSPEGAAPGSTYQNPANLRQERGYLDTQVAHSFVMSEIWDLPYGHGRRFGATVNPVINAVLGDWSLGGILTLTTGRPFNITVSGDPANSGQTDRANVVGDPYSVPGGSRVAQFFNTAAFAPNAPYTFGNLGRNAVIGPGFENLDCSLMKETTPFKVKDQPVNLQVRWEVFNILNHPNFGFPGNVLGTPTFGQLTYANAGRKMQAGLKLIF